MTNVYYEVTTKIKKSVILCNFLAFKSYLIQIEEEGRKNRRIKEKKGRKKETMKVR